MAERRFSATLPALVGALLLAAGGLGGCAESSMGSASTSATEYRDHATGYPFRPAPFYNLDELDELSGY